MRAAAVLIGLTLAACGDDLFDPTGRLVRLSDTSPFPAGDCNGAAVLGDNARGQEVEPMLAVDPRDPMHLLAAWQQDRWSTGGSNGTASAVSFDGGATWARGGAAFSRCSGGAGRAGDYERATDPWVAIAPDGAAYQIAVAFDTADMGAVSAVLVSHSSDGGRTWDEPATLIRDDDADVFNDKESITADPNDATRVYAAWDRLTGQLMPKQPIGHGPAMLSRLGPSGWDAPRAIFDPGADQQTIGNIIAVLPDGSLIDVFQQIVGISGNAPTASLAAIRSLDHGDTWSAPVIVVPALVGGAPHDVRHDVYVRSGGGLPSITVEPGGAIDVVYEDATPTAPGGQDFHQAIFFTRSADGGTTWSPPVVVNGARAVDAFTPSVGAIAGAIGVFYYDTRDDRADQAATYLAAAWMATSTDGGATWHDERLTDPFDLVPAQIGTYYFLGDYTATLAAGDALVPLFAMARGRTDDPTDIYVRP